MGRSPPHTPSAAAAHAAAWFGSRPIEVAPLRTTGFSGVPMARVRPADGPRWFMLKAFARGTPLERAEWVHGLARHLAAAGVAGVAAPLATPAGATVVTDAGGVHWEMVPFVEGVPVEAPSHVQAAAALTALARVHHAAATWSAVMPVRGPAPAVARRIAQARALEAMPWRERRPREATAADDPLVSAIGHRWDRAIAIFEAAGGRDAVATMSTVSVDEVPLQAVLRDVWSDHVLFATDEPTRVAGIVDLHAAGIDVPATDVARLLGSWCPPSGTPVADVLAAWPEAVAAYEAVRPLTAVERGLVPFLHAAGVVCGLDNWFRWTVEERRPFLAPAAVITRVDTLLDALPPALEWLAGQGAGPRLTRGNCSL